LFGEGMNPPGMGKETKKGMCPALPSLALPDLRGGQTGKLPRGLHN